MEARPLEPGEVEPVDAGAPAGQPLPGHPAVGTVVTLAADDHDPAAVGPAEKPPSAAGDGPAGPVDQGRFTDPAGDDGGIPGGHLGRCEDWAHLTQWYGRLSHAPWTIADLAGPA